MKKSLLAAFVVVALFATSCKKDRTCTCTTTTNGVSSSVSGTIKDTKKNAEEECDKGDTSVEVAGFVSTVNCEID